MKTLFLLVVLLGFPLANFAEDAIPASHVGTWKRTEVLDPKTGQGAKAGRWYYLIIRPDGQLSWHGGNAPSQHPPMKISIQNGSEMHQVVNGKDRAVGKALITGDTLKLIFEAPPRIAPSAYVRVSKSIDPQSIPKSQK
jgi:hypothetical protein